MGFEDIIFSLPRKNSNKTSESTLDREQIPPTGHAVVTPQMKNAISEEGRNDVCRDVGGPETS
jgi:hypothetical protein